MNKAIKLKHLSSLYCLEEVILFENKLYERLSNYKKNIGDTKHKYRVIFSYDNYDYVEDRNLVRRLNRAFAKEDKQDKNAR